MTKDPWKDYLTNALVKAGMNKGQVDAGLGEYQSLCGKVDKKLAFESVLESYGNEDTAKASKSVLDELFERGRKEKLGIDKLEFERGPRTPQMVQNETTEVKESRYFREHLNNIKAKFGLPNGLEIEGLAKTKPTTLPEHTAERQRQAAELDRLKIATAKSYKAGRLSIQISI
jgi:hypothetical protein